MVGHQLGRQPGQRRLMSVARGAVAQAHQGPASVRLGRRPQHTRHGATVSLQVEFAAPGVGVSLLVDESHGPSLAPGVADQRGPIRIVYGLKAVSGSPEPGPTRLRPMSQDRTVDVVVVVVGPGSPAYT